MLAKVFALVIVSCAAYGQAFEVVSVKPSAPVASGGRGRGSTGFAASSDAQQVRYSGVTLMRLLTEAYSVKRYQISGPEWLANDTYEITAKLPEGASKAQIPAMLQNLLAERFRLKVHSETKPQRVFALVAARNGPHLVEAKDADRGPGMSFDTSGHLQFVSMTLSGFADTMSRLLDRPVLDMTGIQGNFDITLNVSMQDLAGLKQILAAAGAADTTESNASSSIFSAIQELGLKLESRNAPIQNIVVDRAEKMPTGN
jgi:uncharacterized protein (TIGR03435 family)